MDPFGVDGLDEPLLVNEFARNLVSVVIFSRKELDLWVNFKRNYLTKIIFRSFEFLIFLILMIWIVVLVVHQNRIFDEADFRHTGAFNWPWKAFEANRKVMKVIHTWNFFFHWMVELKIQSNRLSRPQSFWCQRRLTYIYLKNSISRLKTNFVLCHDGISI